VGGRFVGGGSVFFSINAERKLINDKSAELIYLYRSISGNNQLFFQNVGILSQQWQNITALVMENAVYLLTLYKRFSDDMSGHFDIKKPLEVFVDVRSEQLCHFFPGPFNTHPVQFLGEVKKNLVRKTARMKKLEGLKGRLGDAEILDNLESAFKSAFYIHVRYLYNRSKHEHVLEEVKTALFFFIREYSYASMFRYNRDGDFNAPYGGISYNRKDLARKLVRFRSPQFQHCFAHTLIENLDFEAFLRKYPPTAQDFLFLDPPYDTEFSTYTQNSFSFQDHERLATYLLTQCPAKFLLVIKKTHSILSLYDQASLNMCTIPKRYMVCFQDRNERACEHLMIKNF
jgi:DNA adenine methylase